MIQAMNVAAISLPDADPLAEDLEAKQKRRGKRAAITGTDIIPTDDGKAKMFSSFVGPVMALILAYCPGSKEWEGRDAILKAVEDMIAYDGPLSPKSTDGRPPGVFDVNEGSKKGIIKMLKKLQERMVHGTHTATYAPHVSYWRLLRRFFERYCDVYCE
ncbi:hypothetical protein B0H13DRAFT_2309769 [Mycena leptocephala]|nr:hypothetical protein B0H13DRAFT_2309769 [Mycena leptocephala]